ncbi:MAG: hypothetical protein AAF420_04560 [Pseudomonadota bacterium]
MRLITATLISLYLVGCAAPQERNEWIDFENRDESRITLKADDAVRHTARRYFGDVTNADFGIWDFDGHQLLLHYSFTIGDTIYVVNENENLEGYIEQWYDNGILAMGNYSHFGVKARLYEYQLFEYDGAACIMFRHTWGGGRGVDVITSRTKDTSPLDTLGLGHDQLIGSACHGQLRRYSRDDLHQLLDIVELRTSGGSYSVSPAGFGDVSERRDCGELSNNGRGACDSDDYIN